MQFTRRIIDTLGKIYPQRYIHLLLLILLTGAVTSCKSHKKTNDPAYVGEQITSVRKKKDKKVKKSQTVRDRIVDESMTWLGTPYGYGHSEKGRSTDCSGLVVVVFEQIAEIKLPRNSAEQANYCHTLKEKEIEPGDLVFFATGKDAKKVSHVGVMVDHNKFVHASASKGVIISEMTTPYYQRTFIKYGRVPGL